MAFGKLPGAQRAQPQSQAFSDINVTPMVDVMLVLLIIFMLTAPLLASSIKLDLPNTDAAKPVDTPKFVSVVIDKSAQVFLNDQPIELPALAERFKQSAAANPETEVQLRADEAVAYGKVVAVMGLAQKAGLNRIGFIAEPLPKSP